MGAQTNIALTAPAPWITVAADCQVQMKVRDLNYYFFIWTCLPHHSENVQFCSATVMKYEEE